MAAGTAAAIAAAATAAAATMPRTAIMAGMRMHTMAGQAPVADITTPAAMHVITSPTMPIMAFTIGDAM